MTYYLVRHYKDGKEETIPYTAVGTRNAIDAGGRLLHDTIDADYAQIKDCTGKVICTLLHPDRRGEIKPQKIVQLDLF